MRGLRCDGATAPTAVHIDGVNVAALRVGEIYDLHASLATYLIASGYAKPADNIARQPGRRATDKESNS